MAVTDDDCELPANWLTELTAGFERDPRIGVVFGAVDAGVEDGELGFTVRFDAEREGLARGLHESYRVDGVAACMGVRRSAWEACGGLDAMLGVGAPLRSAAELDLALRVLREGYHVYTTPSWRATHRGFRAAHEERSVIDRYWFGTGAAIAKPFRLRHWELWQLLPRLAWRWACGRSGGVVVGQEFRRWRRGDCVPPRLHRRANGSDRPRDRALPVQRRAGRLTVVGGR